MVMQMQINKFGFGQYWTFDKDGFAQPHWDSSSEVK